MSTAGMDLQNQEKSQMDGYYTLDTWNKPSVIAAPPPAIPAIGYKRGYIKKKSKLRWYLAIGLSILITVVVVVVVALVVHFTTSQNKGKEIDEYVSGTDSTIAPTVINKKTKQPLPSIATSVGNVKTSTRIFSTEQTLHKSSQSSLSPTKASSHMTSPTKHTFTGSTEQHLLKTKQTTITSPGVQEVSKESETDAISSSETLSLSSTTAAPSQTFSTARITSATKEPSTLLHSSKSTAQDVMSPTKTSSQTTASKNLTESSTSMSMSTVASSAKPLETKSSSASASSEKLTSSVPSTSSSTENITEYIETAGLIGTTSLENLVDATTIKDDTTAPPFIRDHSGTITDDTVTDVSITAITSTFTVPTDNMIKEPMIIFESSNITLSSKRISLLFEAINVPDWDYLQIFRYEEGTIGEVVAMVTAGRVHPVLDIYDSSFTSQISFKDDALAVTLQTDSFACNKTTNFTSILGTYTTTYVNVTTVYVIQEPPKLTVAHAIVEGKNMTMTCSAELFGSNGRLVWKFKPPGLNLYFDLSSSHTISQEWNNCTTTINSTLTFTPQSHDNGSYFRCEVVDADLVEYTDQSISAETQFLVVPSTFCADKGKYTVHPHPYKPCNLVVYCFQTGPLVYHINCSPGTCYDRNKTKCVPVDTPQD